MGISPSHASVRPGGFTLLELIVVIVILGIVAATALPKFAALASDARKAALGTARGSLEAVRTMYHAQALLGGPAVANIEMPRATVAMVNGYPAAAAGTAAAAGLTAADWAISVNGRDLHVSPKRAPDATTCKVTYSEAIADGTAITPAKLVTVHTGC